MNRVKICGMCDADNVKEIAEAKPDFMGFNFYPGSPRFIGEEPDISVFHNVLPGIKRAGIFFNESNHKILDLSIRNSLDMVQLHGNESPVTCLQLKSLGLTIIKAFNIEAHFSFQSLMQYMPVCDFFLFDTKSNTPGGSGRKFDWTKLEEYFLDKPFFLSGGIGPEDSDVLKSIENRGFYAIDINSRFETSPGFKDVAMVKAFIKEIKMEQL